MSSQPRFIGGLVVVIIAFVVVMAAVGPIAVTADFTNATTETSVLSTEASQPTRNLSTSALAPGQQATVTLNKTALSSKLAFNESFSPGFNTVKLESITTNGTLIIPTISTTSNSSLIVALSNVPKGSEVKVTYSVGVPENATFGSTYQISGQVTDVATQSLDTDEITVEKEEVPLNISATPRTVELGNSIVFELRRSDSNELVEGTIVVNDSAYFTGADGIVNITPQSFGEYEAIGAKANTSATTFVNDSTNVSVVSQDIRSITPTTVQPGGSATVHLSTTTSTSSLAFNEAFSPTFENASIERVSVNGEAVIPAISAADKTGVVVILSELEINSTVTLEYSVGVPENETIGATYEISGNLTDEQTLPLATDTISVEEGSPLEGTPGQYDENNDGKISLSELGNAATVYAQGDLSLSELGDVATVYAQS